MADCQFTVFSLSFTE